jgi:hypothetical protein
MRTLACAVLLLGSWSAELAAQRVNRELGVQGYGLFGDGPRLGAGAFGAFRVGPRARLSLLAGGDDRAGRVEGMVHLLLAPARKRGVGGYLAGGLAADLAEEADARIVAVVGIEGTPGGRGGWVLETGVGGGWRVAAGWRWRR